jgi:lysophospholipase L1-like esterase
MARRGWRSWQAGVVSVLVALAAVLMVWWRPWATGCDAGGGPVRIMPLGDSLTDGFNVPGGYRIELWSLLAADGLCVDFVGSQSNGPSSLPDRDHEGHSGWRVDQIAEAVVPWLRRSRPDVVLLMIGTNDVAQGYALDGAPDRLGALLDRILETQPEVRVVVASIPPIRDPALERRVEAYNAALVGVAASKGARVSFVDAFAALGEADLDPDGVHVNEVGHRKLAGVWAPAIRAVVGGRL